MTWHGGLFNVGVCEWCGHVETHYADGSIQINVCPECCNHTMRNSCPGCRAPAQPNHPICLQCGASYIVTGEKPGRGIMGPCMPPTVEEPTAEERKELEKGVVVQFHAFDFSASISPSNSSVEGV